MDGLNIDHLQSMSTTGGPFSWLTSGKVDAVLDIKFPRDPSEEPALNALLGELADAITSVAIDRIPGQRELATDISDAGWQGVEWTNLSAGIVALHRATKPAG